MAACHLEKHAGKVIVVTVILAAIGLSIGAHRLVRIALFVPAFYMAIVFIQIIIIFIREIPGLDYPPSEEWKRPWAYVVGILFLGMIWGGVLLYVLALNYRGG